MMTRWHQIRLDLERARAMISERAGNDPILSEYREYLDHNELELACDMLAAFGESHDVQPAFWSALGDAATKMSLNERVRCFEAKARGT